MKTLLTTIVIGPEYNALFDRILRRDNRLELIDPRFHCMFCVRSKRIFGAVLRRNWINPSLHEKSKLEIIDKPLTLQRR